MTVLHILCWVVYGLVVGSIARWVHPGEDPEGFLPTIAIGVAGSFIGGAMNFILGWGDHLISPSGVIMGILGGVIACWLYRWYNK